MSVWYNDHDSFACAWLWKLIEAGELPEGEVDGRSVVDVRPDDVRSCCQCHFFAGIGGWAEALRLAGWPREREIWTASLPCQPLSVAGQGRGDADERHLWPAFHRLVAERRPATIVGEQVAGAAGREWFAGVRADLEELGYACGAAVMPACAVGAPHRRERLYWCAVEHAAGERWREGWAEHEFRGRRDAAPGAGFWDDAEWRGGADGKQRRVKPGVRLLADGFPNRVDLLRGFGNAIVPPLAAKFIEAVMSMSR